MISVGIDVAKGKSTVCILKPYGEIVSKPFDISHVEKDFGELAAMLLRFDDEVKVVMEATGIYTVLGYGAASAAVVQKKFICNIVFLIVIAVAANIVGKMKKK